MRDNEMKLINLRCSLARKGEICLIVWCPNWQMQCSAPAPLWQLAMLSVVRNAHSHTSHQRNAPIQLLLPFRIGHLHDESRIHTHTDLPYNWAIINAFGHNVLFVQFNCAILHEWIHAKWFKTKSKYAHIIFKWPKREREREHRFCSSPTIRVHVR